MKIMSRNKLIYIFFLAAVAMGAPACKKQLNVGNPNNPTVSSNITTETSLYAYAQGAVYVNGFKNGDAWLGDSYFSLPYGYIELMGGTIGADLGSNNQVTTVSQPDYVTLDDGTTQVVNPSPQIALIRTYNSRAATNAGNNVLYYQWNNMYSLNSACNGILAFMKNITFSGDAASREATLQAWAYFWKGYAYSQIGSLYYSGLIVDSFNVSTETSVNNNHYLVKDSILARSNYYFNLAITALGNVTSNSDFQTVLTALIPAFCQVDNGQVFTSTAMFIRNINTMLARNILLNKLSPYVNGDINATISKSSTGTMSSTDWQSVQSYAAAGIQSGDYVFTGHTVSTNYFFSAKSGSVAAMTCGGNTGTTYIITERYIQQFDSADARLANNFNMADTNITEFFGTRYSLIDGGAGTAGVWSYGTTTVGNYELYIAGSYEENALMLAEAYIRLNQVANATPYIDAVRAYQGAGLSTLSTSLTQAQAMKVLTSERKVALLFRGLSFYDSRRWGWTYDIKNGGGQYGTVFYTVGGQLNTNATIDYDFLDYWDIPADESVLNPPDGSSAATVNPNF